MERGRINDSGNMNRRSREGGGRRILKRRRLAERGISLAVSDAALDVILSKSYDPVCGARPIRRWIEKCVVNELSEMLIQEEIDESSAVSIEAAQGKDKLVYRVEKNFGLVNPNLGQKSDVLTQVPNWVMESDEDLDLDK